MKAFKRLFVTVFGLFAATAAMAEAKQAPLSFAGYEGETALVDFQVLVKLSEGQYGFSYNDYAASFHTRSTAGTHPATRSCG